MKYIYIFLFVLGFSVLDLCDIPIFEDVIYVEGEVSDEELSEIMELIKGAGLGRIPSKTEMAEYEK